ncbi:MAG: hypothetical protein NTW06_03540, partial [Candidatus Falkowbacteria bacterium]|nr:hypothetical protein [Candidatus Falkowbacteria bacterium]
MPELINLKPKDENDLYESKPVRPSRPRKKKKFLTFSIIFILTFFVVFTSEIIVSGQSSTSWLNNLPIIKQISNFVSGADKKLKGEDANRINILLLGMGDKNHDG